MQGYHLINTIQLATLLLGAAYVSTEAGYLSRGGYNGYGGRLGGIGFHPIHSMYEKRSAEAEPGYDHHDQGGYVNEGYGYEHGHGHYAKREADAIYDPTKEAEPDYISNRHGKSRKYASIACGQFLRKLWTFLDKQQFSCSFYPSMPTILHYYTQLIHCCQKISDIIEKITILGTFRNLGTLIICGHFSTP